MPQILLDPRHQGVVTLVAGSMVWLRTTFRSQAVAERGEVGSVASDLTGPSGRFRLEKVTDIFSGALLGRCFG